MESVAGRRWETGASVQCTCSNIMPCLSTIVAEAQHCNSRGGNPGPPDLI